MFLKENMLQDISSGRTVSVREMFNNYPIQVGDEILKVNHHYFRQLAHEEAVTVLKCTRDFKMVTRCGVAADNFVSLCVNGPSLGRILFSPHNQTLLH